jgi:DNA repair exonuclease SbcCD ATPase subunit
MSVPAEKLQFETISIILNRLGLANFKGQKGFTLDTQGGNIDVFGDNETGKTTLYDAFLWLFFNKDSSNRTAFNVKTLDSNGEALHGLEHTVEGTLNINGKPVVLKKTLVEKWIKKRGEAQKTFTGHNVLHWIDDVPVKEGEYQKYIDSLINEKLFRLITNPLYFNTQLPWQDRRKMLLEIVGDVSDEAVIASDVSLARLTEILNGKKTDDYKKIISERIRKINEEIKMIPPRIDELQRGIKNEEPDYSMTERLLVDQRSSLQRIEEQMVSASSVTKAFQAKQQQLNKLYGALGQKKTELERQANAGRDALIKEELRLTRECSDLAGEVSILESKKKLTQQEYETNGDKMAELRAKWGELNNKQFAPPGPDAKVCPLCHQDLPKQDWAEKVAHAREEFNQVKRAGLKDITEKGQALAAQNEELTEGLVLLEQQVAQKTGAKNDLESQLKAVKAKLDGPWDMASPESHPEYIAIQSQIDTLQAEIEQPADNRATELLEQKREVTREIERLNAILNNKEIRAKTVARIEELKQDERKKAERIAELEGHKFLLENFTKAKVSLLESNINSRFKTVTFKMFNTLINGAVEDCCEALINGVPFADANNAAKINAGLDIINTLTQHFGVSAPIFIDNREAITNLIDVEAQVISLIVSEKDKSLRVEPSEGKYAKIS